MAKSADLCIYEFRERCRAEGFCFLRPVGQFIDNKFPRAGLIAPVLGPRRQVLRRETLDKLLQNRAQLQAEQVAKVSEKLRKQALADKLAPQALPPARTTLTKAPAIRQMAEDMRSSIFGQATWAGLKALGWSENQLRTYGDQARQTACELEGAV